ncbi:MAG: bifunctional acetate--CoA ligase family protein/GNAT family N-acetyltransferase [Acidimicrobiales bacterium]
MTDLDVLLADGSTAQVRDIRPDDAEALVAFHARLSQRTVTLRFFGPRPVLSDQEVRRFTTCDGIDRAALVVRRDDQIVAVVRYDRSPGKDEAEVAFVVDDAVQGKGIATVLLEHLAERARTHGIRSFVADTLSENSRMLAVLRDAGFARQYSRDAEVVRVVLDIAPSPAAVDAADERDRQAVISSVARILRPRSVAVVGAARAPGTIGHQLLSNLLRGGFEGPVYPVNPSASYVASIAAWPSVEEIPGPVDLAVVAVPAPSVREVVVQCGHKGVGALVVISAGFAEAGPEGEVEQRELTRLAHSYGMRIVGPNCFGVINTEPGVSMNATFAPTAPVSGNIGFASQSGGLGIALLREIADRGLGLSSFVSTGNKADVSGNDLLRWWEQDASTSVVLLYLESFGNPRKFSRVARRVSRTKPIVAVKSGRSSAGSRGASSHTAAITSPDEAVDALFRQTGVVRVDTIEELFDVASLLADSPLPAGDRVAIVTNAGGPGVLAADACVSHGLSVPEFSETTTKALAAQLPAGAGIHNPVDMIASATAKTYRATIELLVESGEADAFIVIFTPPLVTRADEVALAVHEVAQSAASKGYRAPILACFLGDPDAGKTLAEGTVKVPHFAYPETAARALAHAVRYARWRTQPELGEAPPEGTDANAARRLLEPLVARHGPDCDIWISGMHALSLLSTYAIQVAETKTSTTAHDAVRCAAQLGYPVALKAIGDMIVHKSEVGGVRLGIVDADTVVSAYENLRRTIGNDLEGVVVQRMCGGDDTVEMMAGFVRHPSFGPQVVVGLGGKAVELADDHRSALAPLAHADALGLVSSLRSAKLLTGFRGSRPVDVDSLVDLLVRLGQLAEDLPELAEADCNPALVSPDGTVVVDARFRLRPPTEGHGGMVRHL